MKTIFLIWDLDGGIGQINSTLPYNFNFKNLNIELEYVDRILSLLDHYQIKCTFAITGFSAEEGKYPYVFPELIKKIADLGHEIASHTWRHEWIPLFTEKQIIRSLTRSKEALELVTGAPVNGLVPPHNRPMTWVSRGAYSLGDRGLYPLFKMGDMGNLIKLSLQTGYKWMRVSYHPLFKSLKPGGGRVVSFSGMKIFENHYNGFDDEIIQLIKHSNASSFTISAHPFMLSLSNKRESWSNFKKFIETFSENSFVFKRPYDIM